MKLRTLAFAASAALFLAAPAVRGQAAPQPATPQSPLAAAQAQLAAGDAKAAKATLEAFLADNASPPPQAHLVLGNALRALGELDRALAAYLAVPQRARVPHAQALFRAATLEAERGRGEQALELVVRLGATGAFDMDLVRDAPELAALRDDPRFVGAMFSPDDFERPFVEPVRVIHEWVGENKGDQYSWIARGIPDVDGDGAREIVTSAPSFGATAQSQGQGRVYVYSGRSGRLLWMQAGQPSEALGSGLEGAGDVDADGVADVIAGAPGGQRAYVYSGRDGRTLRVLAPPQDEGGFGTSASGAGDHNGDGHADVIVGSPGPSGPATGPAPAGRAHVFSGKDGSLLLTLSGEGPGHAFGSIVAGAAGPRGTFLVVGAPGAGERSTGRVYVYPGLVATPRFVIDSDETGGALGAMFASVIGDLDGDGTADVFASDFANAASGPGTGRIYVHSGKDGRRLLTLTGEGPGENFGIGAPDVGDVDGDGHDDLVLGAWQHATAALSGGKIYVYSGKDGRVLRTITGRVPGETLGFDATGVGDIDGDGATDLLVTSSWSNVRGFRSGRMYVISGR